MQWPGFQLKSVDVSGTHATTREDVLAAAAFGRHPNIWLVNVGAARRRIEALPFVHTAKLTRIPPSTISVVVTERVPDGCVVGAGGGVGLVDPEGRVLSDSCPGGPLPSFELPSQVIPSPGQFIHSAALASLQGDAGALRIAGTPYRSLRFDRFGQLDATLPDGIVVHFGDETDLEAKARLVDPIVRTAQARLGTVQSVDLRAPGTPVVRYGDGATAKQSPPPAKKP